MTIVPILLQLNLEKLLEQGLAVALAVTLVGCLIWFAKRQMVIIETHIKANTEILGSLKTSIEAFTEYVQDRDKNGGRRP